MNRQIQVFEYQSISIDNQFFTNRHYEKLARFNEKHGNKYFTLGYKKIVFGNYVGVIQVDNLTIEILPKADVLSGDEYKWRNALLSILKSCGYLKVETLSHSKLRIKNFTLLELFLEYFLNEVEKVIHTNFIKDYRFVEGNLPKLKGRILFEKQLKHNLFHKEVFYTSHQIYDHNTFLNIAIKKALITLLNLPINKYLINRSKELLLYFEDSCIEHYNIRGFEKLKFNRHNQHYREAIQYAKLILFKNSPALSSGTNDVLAILFDMNLLFEKFIYSQIKKQEPSFKDIQLSISGQSSRVFWENKTIRPDIVLEYGISNKKRIILDTKWKVLQSPNPSDSDLKQMFTYNIHFNSEKSILIYPYTSLSSTRPINFRPSIGLDKKHYCQLFFLDLFDLEGNIKKDFANTFLEEILN